MINQRSQVLETRRDHLKHVLSSDARVSADGVRLGGFDAEPAAWWPNGLGGWLKPDAYVRLASGNFVDHWWIEVRHEVALCE